MLCTLLLVMAAGGQEEEAAPTRGTVSFFTARSQLSVAWLTALAAAARCTMSTPVPDNTGVDTTLTRERELGDGEFGYAELDVQLKTVTFAETVNDYISYSVEKPTYDRLRTSRVLAPRILVLMTVPDDIEDWIRCRHHEWLRLHKSAYWLSLLNEPAIQTQSRTLYVPKANVFDLHEMCRLLDLNEAREPLVPAP